MKIYPNNKAWVTKHIKSLLNKKKKAVQTSNKEQLWEVQKKLKVGNKSGRKEYRRKLEQNFQTNDLRKVWKGMNLMSGRRKANNVQVSLASTDCANDLNSLYARFDSCDFGCDRDRLKKTLTKAAKKMVGEGIVVDSDKVLSVLKKTKPYKAAGPDGVVNRVLNKCADQLTVGQHLVLHL